jgi:hypothetical protein
VLTLAILFLLLQTLAGNYYSFLGILLVLPIIIFPFTPSERNFQILKGAILGVSYLISRETGFGLASFLALSNIPKGSFAFLKKKKILGKELLFLLVAMLVIPLKNLKEFLPSLLTFLLLLMLSIEARRWLIGLRRR